MKSICFVIPYFGHFKNYFQLFLNSCRKNPTVDWLILTDTDQKYSWPANVHLVRTTFEEFRARVQKNFDFDICLDTPYKLCDYKPAYGEILHEELSSYDFWGYCDCDMVFGNIRHFLTEDLLTRYDKLFTRGHLSLYRNTPQVNSFYRTQTYLPYKTVYSPPQKTYAFDEWAGVSEAWSREKRPYYDELIMDDIRVGMKGFYPSKEVSGVTSPYHEKNKDMTKAYRKMKHIFYEYKNGTLKRRWLENGIKREEEVFYVHFQKRNLKISRAIHSLRICEDFIIRPNVIEPWRSYSAAEIRHFLTISDQVYDDVQHIKGKAYVIYRQYFRSTLKKYLRR